MSITPDEHEQDHDTDHGHNGLSGRDAALAALRQEHARIGQERDPLILEVPGLEHMAIRYVWYPLSADEKAARKAQQLGLLEQSLLLMTTTLINACDEILLMDPEDSRANEDGWAPLTEPGEPKIRFDRVLCDVMQWPNPEIMSARQIVRTLFGGERGERALIRQGARVLQWLDGDAAQIGEDFAKA